MKNVKPDELQRLSLNHHSLLNTTPEMVMLLLNDGSIEYMNPQSSAFINSLSDRQGKEKIQLQLQKVINSLDLKSQGPKTCIGNICNLYFECRIAPFIGYKGDQLYWFILRDLKRKQKDSFDTPGLPMNVPTIIGSSKEMSNLQSIVARVASTDTTVLISGESGTGKELVAKLLQEKSLRKNKPFLTINCNTISDLLLESELFGYEKGSFTGAVKQRKGKFEIVDGGTIFLDEIGDISPRMQAALLRVLQNGEMTRVGGHMPIKVNVRILAATNRILTDSVKNGDFRLDLFYRLNIINIVLPPLRDRKDDIFDLTTHFIQKYNQLFDKSIEINPEKILNKLQKYNWPGNVRELENVIHRAVLMGKNTSLSNKDISFDMAPSLSEEAKSSRDNQEPYDDLPLKSIIAQLEKEVIETKLTSGRGNVSKAAESLEISKAALYEKMKRYGISAKSLR